MHFERAPISQLATESSVRAPFAFTDTRSFSKFEISIFGTLWTLARLHSFMSWKYTTFRRTGNKCLCINSHVASRHLNTYEWAMRAPFSPYRIFQIFLLFTASHVRQMWWRVRVSSSWTHEKSGAKPKNAQPPTSSQQKIKEYFIRAFGRWFRVEYIWLALTFVEKWKNKKKTLACGFCSVGSRSR